MVSIVCGGDLSEKQAIVLKRGQSDNNLNLYRIFLSHATHGSHGFFHTYFRTYY